MPAYTPDQRIFPGLNANPELLSTAAGRLVLDARVFGLIPEHEDCGGWGGQRLQALEVQVNARWDQYQCLVSRLPPELAERHHAIYDAAMTAAREAGWDPDREVAAEG